MSINQIVEQARTLRNNGDIESAISLLDQSITTQASHELYFARAICHDLANRYNAAIQDYTLAIDMCSNIFKYHLYRGQVYSHNLHDNTAAAHDFIKCIEINPESAIAHKEYAYCLIQQGLYNQAYDISVSYATIAPADPEASFCLGQCLLGMNRSNEAIAQLSNAVSIDPSISYYWAALARAFKSKGDFIQARSAYDKAIAIEQNDPLLFQSRAELSVLLGDAALARNDLNAASLLKPDQQTSMMIQDLLDSLR